MNRRIGLVLVGAMTTVLGLSLAPGAAAGFSDRPTERPRAVRPAASTPVSPVTPIQHLVVVTQDQHSFDNYFGTRPGVDGLPVGVCLPRREAVSVPCVAPFPIVASEVRPSLRADLAAEVTSVNGGRMDGFVYAQTTRRVDGRAAMGYYRPQDIPVVSELADNAVLFDHWFSSVPGGSIPNRLFAVSAHADPGLTEVPVGGWQNIPLIFDRLQAAGVSWRIYVEHYEPALTISTAGLRARRGGQVARVPVLATTRFTRSPELMTHVVDLRQYYEDLAAGTMPAVSYIVSTSSTERPPADPAAGQVLIRNVVNALSGSSAWPHSALLLTYDSSGGWYDHVAPGTLGGARLGLRVPTILLSPYASVGTVDHTSYDSASVLRFIEHNWSLAALGTRDAKAADLGAAFAFAQPARQANLIGITDNAPPVGHPDSRVIYLSYLLAAIIAAAVVVWALLGRRQTVRQEIGRA